jgi:exopolysaccharide biosynthesis polyprenyl glycosylphosphotransferase
MVKEHATLFRRIVMISDAVILTASFLLAYFIRNQFLKLNPIDQYLGLFIVFSLIWLVVLNSLGMYRSFRTREIKEAFIILLQAAVFSFVFFASFLYLFKIEGVSRILITLFLMIGTVLLGLKKIVMMWAFRYLRDRGLNFRNILLVGTGPRAQHFMKLIESHPEWGLRIIGLVDQEKSLVYKMIREYKVLGTLNDIPDIIHNNVVDEIVFVVPGLWLQKIQHIIHQCETEGIKVNVAVDVYNPEFSRMKLSRFYSFPILSFESTPDKLGHLLIKRIFDTIFSTIIIAVLSPLFLAVALLIKWTSPGPILYKQLRCGLNGRKFLLYKFRTMEIDAEKKLKDLLRFNEMQGPVFKIQDDPRITPIGKFLRRFSLDEIPQFFNVIKGDMSLVGPRPPLPSEVELYDDWHRRRLRMRPGITCLWQINGRNKITDFNEWANLDLEYIDHWSLGLDFKIFFKTIPVVLTGAGAK